VLKLFLKGSGTGPTVGDDAEVNSYPGLAVNFVPGAPPALEIFAEAGEAGEDGQLPIAQKIELSEVGGDLEQIRALLAEHGFHRTHEAKAEL